VSEEPPKFRGNYLTLAPNTPTDTDCNQLF